MPPPFHQAWQPSLLCRYFTAFDQYFVESYFKSTGALIGDYWQGINRTSSSAPFFYFNGTELGNNISNTNPYVHWSWYHPSFKSNPGCATSLRVAASEANAWLVQ